MTLLNLSVESNEPSFLSYNNQKLEVESLQQDFYFSGQDWKVEDDQYEAIKQIGKWLYENPKSRSPYLRLAGYAGTGKTLIIAYILSCVEEMLPKYMHHKEVAVATYTWRASLILRSRDVHSSSIHSLFYEVDGTNKSGPVFRKLLPEEIRSMYSLIIIDEASMLDKSMREDILSYGVPVLFVGDGGQLPPISNFPEDKDFMENAEVKLTKIRRQALDSPIIRLSIDIREGKRINYGKYGDGVWKVDANDVSDNLLLKSTKILCGKNATRTNLNKYHRNLEKLDINKMPYENEIIVGLNNIPTNGCFNGQLWTVVEDYSQFSLTESYVHTLKLLGEDGQTILQRCAFPEDLFFKGFATQAQMRKYAFENKIYLVDFGYALTVHKSQGSSFDRLIVFEEFLGNKTFHKKWLYTAVTRAVSKCIIATNIE